MCQVPRGRLWVVWGLILGLMELIDQAHLDGARLLRPTHFPLSHRTVTEPPSQNSRASGFLPARGQDVREENSSRPLQLSTPAKPHRQSALPSRLGNRRGKNSSSDGLDLLFVYGTEKLGWTQGTRGGPLWRSPLSKRLFPDALSRQSHTEQGRWLSHPFHNRGRGGWQREGELKFKFQLEFVGSPRLFSVSLASAFPI